MVQEHVDRLPVGVEKQACREQQAVLRFSVSYDGVQDEHCRQEDAQEDKWTEYHGCCTVRSEQIDAGTVEIERPERLGIEPLPA